MPKTKATVTATYEKDHLVIVVEHKTGKKTFALGCRPLFAEAIVKVLEACDVDVKLTEQFPHRIDTALTEVVAGTPEDIETALAEAIAGPTQGSNKFRITLKEEKE
jgi:hypothetical protein